MKAVKKAVAWVNESYLRMCAVVTACVVAPMLGFAASALAVETEGEKQVKTVAEQVSSEGVVIILAVLAGLVGLIALSIVLPKAVHFIKRFI